MLINLIRETDGGFYVKSIGVRGVCALTKDGCITSDNLFSPTLTCFPLRNTSTKAVLSVSHSMFSYFRHLCHICFCIKPIFISRDSHTFLQLHLISAPVFRTIS